MKKYPITYKGKKYEVRWEHTMLFDYVTIYEERKIFGIKYLKEIYSMDELGLETYLKNLGVYEENNPTYYIDQVKYLFELMEKSILEKTKKLKDEELKQKTLDEWDGVIN